MAGSSASWEDEFIIDGAGLTGTTGFIEVSVLFRNIYSSPPRTLNSASFSFGTPSGSQFERTTFGGSGDHLTTFSAEFIFGQYVGISVGMESAAVPGGADLADSRSMSAFWNGISSIRLSDGTLLDSSQLSFSSLSGTNWLGSMVPNGFLVDDPLLLEPGVGTGDGGVVIPAPTISCTALGCIGTGRFYDPEVAVGYEYAASEGLQFNGFSIPYAYGDGTFFLWLYDDSTGDSYDSGLSVATDEYFDFAVRLGLSAGVDRFLLKGIEVEAMVDPDDPTGFVTYLQTVGEGEVYMTPLRVTVGENTVPEPGTYALMFAGMALIGTMLRRRRPSQLN